MAKRLSKLERTRRNGDTQVEYQRANILAAAERIFLAKGVEHTSMSDIAAEAGITRASLYRYFSDRDPIAFEIASRMLRRITESAALGQSQTSLEQGREGLIRMIQQFPLQIEAHRYLGMFDHLYSERYPSVGLADWYKERIAALGGNWAMPKTDSNALTVEHMVMLGNCVLSFLQKMAARGQLLAEEQGVPVERQLALFQAMVDGYFENLLAHHQWPNARA